MGQKLSVTCTLLTVQGVFIYLAGGRSPNQRSPPFSFCDVTTTLHITHSIQLTLVAPRRFEESKYHEWKYFSIENIFIEKRHFPVLIREQILKNKDKNILVEFRAKIHTHAKYVHGCIFKIVLVLL